MKKRLPVPVLLITLLALRWPCHKSRTHQLFGTIVSRGTAADSVIALTFDDGPSPAVRKITVHSSLVPRPPRQNHGDVVH